MREPIYDCMRCGETIERDLQGKVIWCKRCRQIWQEGFWQGVMSHDAIMELMNETTNASDAMHKLGTLPYEVMG